MAHASEATTVEPVLTEAEVARFWDQGYLLVKGALSREEASYYRQVILDMVPRDLSIPAHWGVNAGRIKPMRLDGSHTFDTPELLPLLFNERVYAVAVQLFGSPRLRVGDGSLGITLRNGGSGPILSQSVHLDATVPAGVDNFLFTPEEAQLGGCYYLSDVAPEGGGIHVVPGGHRLVEEKARAQRQGRALYNNWKKIDDFPETVEVTGEAGDFALLHHLMPHAASHNRRPTPRVAQFTRFTMENHPHHPGEPAPADRYNGQQLAAMTPLGRKLLGVDAW
jgi:ectoine hydroxylase-related dioxygenase (phytanoyl-CoA dioxygenase family)